MKIEPIYFVLIVFIALFPFNTDALYFILNPGNTECIHFYAKKADHIVGSFEIDSAYEGVRVSLFENEASSKILDKVENSGDFSINPSKDTEYQLCFKNLMNSVQQTVNFSIKSMAHNSNINNVMSNVESKKLIESMEKLYERISVASEKQKYALTRKRFQMEAIESSRKKAAIWSILELLLSFGLVAVQVYYIKSYFQVKYLV
ncbi:emp24/gp25L/p24 family/GOLD family protein [Cryptosporidium meleagridis]|uniref:Emp24/gp25L/p24 family/GOLD family protein n=1 Tax=Cryptosporidium meleagridis TaxID=93969 RepID=A0A2P4YYE9_9CRYT|nr:emp24/gp25L/p24 family/GOLD family protein [Cryptosporidium meleagridis]